jgi:hypothetical protein
VLTRSGEKDVERAVVILSSYLLGQLKELTSALTVQRRIIQKVAAGNSTGTGIEPVAENNLVHFWCFDVNIHARFYSAFSWYSIFCPRRIVFSRLVHI